MENEDVPILIGSTALKLLGFSGDIEPRDVDLICSLNVAKDFAWNADSKLGNNLFAFSRADEKSKKKRIGIREKSEIEKTKKPRVRSKRPRRPHSKDNYENSEDSNESRSYVSVSDASNEVDGDDITVVDVHVIDSCSWGMKELYEKCRNLIWRVSYHDLVLSPTFTKRVAIPPIEWLYALYKGHLYRIPNVFSKQVSNIALWKKYMNTYSTIREKYGYQKLDFLLFGGDCEDRNPREIFEREFAYVIDQLGDAPSLENKEEESFFEDNVTRYMDHDVLHKAVAIMNRGNDAIPLFPKFIVDPNKSVMMDEKLFRASSFEEQIQTLKEEIIVLYLERKAIPSAIECGDKFETLWEFDEIVCHFITNLCGDGHSWLREYCINHYPLLSNESSYPVKEMRSFVEDLRKDGPITSDEQVRKHLPLTIASIEDFIKLQEIIVKDERYDGGNLNSQFLMDLKKQESELKEDSKFKWIKPEEGNDNDECLSILAVHQLELEDSECNFTEEETYVNYEMWNKTPEIRALFDKYFGTERDVVKDVVLWDQDKNILFNVKEGVACYHDPGDTSRISLFLIEMVRATFCVHSLVILFDDEKLSFEKISNQLSVFAEKKRKTVYYKSTCGPSVKIKKSLTYLGHYGESFPELESLLEKLGRIQTGIFSDDETDDSSY